MGQLRTHDLPELLSVETISGVQGGQPWTNHVELRPGMPVFHKKYPGTYGICVSKRWGPDDKPMQCEVLWSEGRSPDIDIKVVDVNPSQSSRKLKFTWSTGETNHIKAFE